MNVSTIRLILISVLTVSNISWGMDVNNEKLHKQFPSLQPLQDEIQQAALLSYALPEELETLVTRLKEIEQNERQAPLILLTCDDEQQAGLWPRALAYALGDYNPRYFKLNGANKVSNIYQRLLVLDLAALYSYHTKTLAVDADEKTNTRSFLRTLLEPHENGNVFLICGLYSGKIKEVPDAILERFYQLNANFNTVLTIPKIPATDFERIEIVRSGINNKNYYIYNSSLSKKIEGIARNRFLIKSLSPIPTEYLKDAIKGLPFTREVFRRTWYLDSNALEESIK